MISFTFFFYVVILCSFFYMIRPQMYMFFLTQWYDILCRHIQVFYYIFIAVHYPLIPQLYKFYFAAYCYYKKFIFKTYPLFSLSRYKLFLKNISFFFTNYPQTTAINYSWIMYTFFLRQYCTQPELSNYKHIQVTKDTLVLWLLPILHEGELNVKYRVREVWIKTSTFLYFDLQTLYLPLIVVLGVFYLLSLFYNLNLIRQLAVWFVIGILFFLLFSGFNFFLKRYRFGKFTSSIQRFWKRTNTYFWVLEGFLFSLFFYYYLNSSQEPLYFYDASALTQTYLGNISNFYFSLSLLVVFSLYTYYLILNVTTFTIKQLISHLTIITLGYVYVFLLESYQFYYTVSGFFESNWVFIEDENLWMLDFEAPRIRVKLQYLSLALIAKYWHFLFLFLTWLFFIFKCFEQQKVSFVFFGFNLQNLLILILLNLLLNIQWLKWLVRRFYDTMYYWFWGNPNFLTLSIVGDEFKLLVGNL